MEHSTDQPSASTTAIVCVLGATALVGILGPKLLYMTSWYPGMVGSWPVDAQYLIHPIFRMVLVLVSWRLVCALNAPNERPVLGIRVGWRGAGLGVLIGLAATLPMLALGVWSGTNTASRYLVHTSLMPGITEEIFYRAFLFGVLVQSVRWNPWIAAIVTGVVFGLAHVDITPSEGETILGQLNLWLAMIGLGGFMYAWIIWKAPWNLWVVMALHFAMNLWWDCFDLTQTPLGGGGATIARVLSVGVVVYLVVFRGVLGPMRAPTIERDEHETKPTA